MHVSASLPCMCLTFSPLSRPWQLRRVHLIGGQHQHILRSVAPPVSSPCKHLCCHSFSMQAGQAHNLPASTSSSSSSLHSSSTCLPSFLLLQAFASPLTAHHHLRRQLHHLHSGGRVLSLDTNHLLPRGSHTSVAPTTIRTDHHHHHRHHHSHAPLNSNRRNPSTPVLFGLTTTCSLRPLFRQPPFLSLPLISTTTLAN